MEILFSERLQSYLEQHKEINENKRIEIAKGIIKILGNFIYDFYVPNSWHLKDIKRIDNSTIIFYWESESGEAMCPECSTVSYRKCNTYKKRTIQDLPIAGMTVYHVVKVQRFYCNNPECDHNTFVEQFYEIVDSHGRHTTRLKDHIIRQTVESSCNATAKTLRESGIIIGKDAVIRMVKKKGLS
jgi:transposase